MASKYPRAYRFLQEFLKERGINIKQMCKLFVRDNLLLYEYRYTVCMCLYNELDTTAKFISEILGLSEYTITTTLNAFPIEVAINKHKKLYYDLIHELMKKVK